MDKMMDDRMKERLNFGKLISQANLITEEEYDTIDQYFNNVSIGFESEFRTFLVLLVKQYSGQFRWSFLSPKSEMFGTSWIELQGKYNTMDDAGKEDLHIRIGAYFKKFFLDMLPWAGEQTSLAIAEMYKEMMIARLREQDVSARKV